MNLINKSIPEKQNPVLLDNGKIPERIFFFVSGEAYASNTTGRFTYFTLTEDSYFGEAHA